MSYVDAIDINDRTPSKQSQCERYVDGVPPSPTAAVELEHAIYERLEKARKVENDLARDEQNRRDLRKQKFCVFAFLLLALLALSIGLARGVNRHQAISGSSERSKVINGTVGPFRDDLKVMLVGLAAEIGLSSNATKILEQDYCAFFVSYYNKPLELDWIRSTVDIAECSAAAREISLKSLNEDSTNGLLVELNQTLTLKFSKAENFTYTKASINYVVSAPFKDKLAVALLVEKLKNQSATNEFSTLKNIHFAPETNVIVESQAPTAASTGGIITDPAVTPSKAPSSAPATPSPMAMPEVVTSPTDLESLEKEKGKEEKGKYKDKKKNAKDKI